MEYVALQGVPQVCSGQGRGVLPSLDQRYPGPLRIPRCSLSFQLNRLSLLRAYEASRHLKQHSERYTRWKKFYTYRFRSSSKITLQLTRWHPIKLVPIFEWPIQTEHATAFRNPPPCFRAALLTVPQKKFSVAGTSPSTIGSHMAFSI